ncbi:hypothetical protein GCM10027084_27590 [Pseudoxanthomonas sangjuensis]|uniref:hypothetical protein n=1 Tax=Pseudoxanthomonas sangjuensis TaxID=1503750 RepID=UPI001390E44D|nr:hypothetical protein [Pseudoxanthomonas sangjuensis]KAF1714570.1 hypothetical protein CSC71_04185 [Pseudoxanthomonas sangjuensis]
MKDDQLDAALQAEYFYVQKVIEDFDSRALTIKAWSVTFSLAAIASALASHAHVVFLVAFISALLFWLLEAIWKSFQAGYYKRAEAIERHFAGTQALSAPFQIGTTWFRHWGAGGHQGWTRFLLWPHVALPHAVVAFIGGLLFLLSLAGVVRP